MQTRNGFSLLEMLICVSLILIFASFSELCRYPDDQ